MRIICAILTLACFFLALSSQADASERVWGQQGQRAPLVQDVQAAPMLKSGAPGPGDPGTNGDPDELGGGFRNNEKPPKSKGLFNRPLGGQDPESSPPLVPAYGWFESLLRLWLRLF